MHHKEHLLETIKKSQFNYEVSTICKLINSPRSQKVVRFADPDTYQWLRCLAVLQSLRLLLLPTSDFSLEANNYFGIKLCTKTLLQSLNLYEALIGFLYTELYKIL